MLIGGFFIKECGRLQYRYFATARTVHPPSKQDFCYTKTTMWAKSKGFTIVELLVVIVVIAILATVTIVAFNGVQARARDSQRMSDITAIDKAIKLYIVDNGHAPDFSGACPVTGGPDSGCFANDIAGLGPNGSPYSWSKLETELSPYIKKLPVDPCGLKCYKEDGLPWHSGDSFFSYRYNAPADMPEVYNGEAPTSEDYFIGAENLESKSSSFAFGFGSF
jgi:prepilin-type N-terminal cleavage/methylation domain-containing protein